MGQKIRGVPEDPALNAAAAESGREASIGRFLAAQRKLRGISLDELADLTRIPRRSLERLEDGVFDRQADGFARGFVRTVALALGLDAEAAVMRLLEEPAADDEDQRFHWASLRRWAAGTALVLAGAGSVVAVWTFLRAEVHEYGGSDEIIYRRDVVRELAERERAVGAAAEPLDSPREGNPD